MPQEDIQFLRLRCSLRVRNRVDNWGKRNGPWHSPRARAHAVCSIRQKHVRRPSVDIRNGFGGFHLEWGWCSTRYGHAVVVRALIRCIFKAGKIKILWLSKTPIVWRQYHNGHREGKSAKIQESLTECRGRWMEARTRVGGASCHSNSHRCSSLSIVLICCRHRPVDPVQSSKRYNGFCGLRHDNVVAGPTKSHPALHASTVIPRSPGGCGQRKVVFVFPRPERR